MAASFGYLLNQINFGLLPFGYELWTNKASSYIDKFSVISVWKLVVWILSAFSRCQRFSEHELGAKFECDQELGISCIDFQLLSSWMFVFVWWKWDEFANNFAPGTGTRYWCRPTDRDQPCQSRTSLYSLDILYNLVIHQIKTSNHIPSTFTLLCSC